MRTCGKTIEKNKEMIIPKVKIVINSSREWWLVIMRVSWAAGNIPLLNLGDY